MNGAARFSGALPPGTAHVHAVAARTPVIARCQGANTCEWLTSNVVMVSVNVTLEVSP